MSRFLGLVGLILALTLGVASSQPIILPGGGAATTADELAADPTNCPAGQYPLGIAADGTVQDCTAAGAGTVTSVGASVPQGFSISGSPVTGSGTLAVARAAVNAIGALGASPTINWNSGVVQSGTLSADATVAFSNPVTGTIYTLILTQDAATARTVTWPAAVRWPGGVTLTVNPALSSVTVVKLYYDGTNYTSWMYGGTHSAVSYQTTGAGASEFGQALQFTGDISPAQLTANTNDWNPTGLSTATTIRLSTDASRNLTGLAGGADGRIIILHNIGTENLVILTGSGSSSAANQFYLEGNLTLGADASAAFRYDATSSKWRALHSVVTVTGSSTTTFTNKTLDAEATGNVVTLPFFVEIPFAACPDGTTAGLNWDADATGETAPTAACNDTGTLRRPSADFAGGAVNSLVVTTTLPDDWTGNVDFNLDYVITAASPTGNVEWDISTACRADGESWDGSFNLAQTITSAVGAQNAIKRASQATLTMTGCAAGEHLTIKVSRDGTNDTNNDTAKALTARIKYRRQM